MPVLSHVTKNPITWFLMPYTHLCIFKTFAFSLSSNTHRSICVHTKVLVRFRQSTPKRSKTPDRIARCGPRWTLSACSKHTSACDIFDSFIFIRFRPSTPIERFHMTSRRPYWWSKTTKRAAMNLLYCC